jgi:hypothetical protein
MKNEITVVQYDESTDMLTVEIVERRIEHIPSANFQVFSEHLNERPFVVLTDKERAIAKLFDDYYQDDPHDLVSMTAEY